MTAPNAWRGGQPYLLLAVFFVLSAAFRPVLPVDETRYLTVAWEMWLRGDFLVPYINGEPYSHKPPLLFWLIHLGWAVFGVNDWWPRLVAPLRRQEQESHGPSRAGQIEAAHRRLGPSKMGH